MVFFSKRNTKQSHRRYADSPERSSSNDSDLNDRYLFRRNRTLTGSSSSQISSANERMADMQSTRVQAHQLARKRRHVGLLFLGAISVSTILFLLLNQFTATLSFTANTSAPLDAQRYEGRVQAYLNERPSERLRFLLNIQQLTGYLQADFPEILEVRTLGAAGFGKSKLHFIMRRPAVSWELPGSGRQYVDTTGVTFTQNYYPTPEVEVIDQSGVRIEAGQTIASSRFLSFVGRLIGAVRSQNASVTQIVIPPNTTRQVEMHLKDIAFPVKVSIDRPVGEQAEDAVRAIRWLREQGRVAQYIDVRISGKVYYK